MSQIKPLALRPKPPHSAPMRLVLVSLFLLLAACGRPLTVEEKTFIAGIHGETLNTARVRLVDHAPLRAYTFRFPKRPRVTCQERLLPEPKTEIITGAPAAAVLFNTVYLNHQYALPNYLKDFPDRLYLLESMFLAHEMTHVWQWQNRKLTGYHPLKAAREHQTKADPYLFDLETSTRFLDYGYEQQGSIVEEYVCCAALAPNAPRTKRLFDMLSEVFPVQSLPKTRVIPPWDGADFDGICS